MLTVFLLAASTIFLLSIDMGWSNVLTSQRNDLVFEQRNQEYGAYALRREHNLNLFYALLIGIGLVLSLIFIVSIHAPVPQEEVPQLSMIPVDITPAEPFETIQKHIDSRPASKAPATATRDLTDVEVSPDPVVSTPDPIAPPIGPTDPTGPVGPSAPGPIGTGGTGAAPASPAPDPTPTIPDYASVMPTFPGGDAALMNFIKERVSYDEFSLEQGVEGTIFISFVVTATGEIADVKLVRNIPNGQRLSNQALKAVKELPRWNPGKQNDQPVAVRKTIPFKFEIK